METDGALRSLVQLLDCENENINARQALAKSRRDIHNCHPPVSAFAFVHFSHWLFLQQTARRQLWQTLLTGPPNLFHDTRTSAFCALFNL
jgi:hypothetical protein